jgi:hypothetical protein
MKTERAREPTAAASPGQDALDRLAAGLVVLWQTYRHARGAGGEIWQYAVLVSTLEALGLSRSDLRGLVARGYLAHAVDCTEVGAERRRFRDAPLAFGRRRCFVLTEAGAAFVGGALGLGEDESVAPERIHPARDGDGTPDSGRPRWDRRHRALRVGRTIVKQFHRPAPNQELILTAFEEQEWPGRIDDPLPGDPDLVAQERLHDAIKCLNRGMDPPLIHFRGDGTGRGIVWDLSVPAGSEKEF